MDGDAQTEPERPAPGDPSPQPDRRPDGAHTMTSFEAAQIAEMTRFEEQLRVGTESVVTGAVRLHKHVVAEQAGATVPVRHEEAQVERVPITDRNDSAGEHRFGKEYAEVTLHEERPTLTKDAVPVETGRVSTRTLTEPRTVSETVRKETVDVDDERDSQRQR